MLRARDDYNERVQDSESRIPDDLAAEVKELRALNRELTEALEEVEFVDRYYVSAGEECPWCLGRLTFHVGEQEK